MRVKPVFSIALLFMIVSIVSGCAQLKVVTTIKNGGDAPPFVEIGKVKNQDLSALAPSETVLAVQGNIENIVKCNEAHLNFLVWQEPERAKSNKQDSAMKEAKKKENQAQKEKDAKKEEKETKKGEAQKKETKKEEQDANKQEKNAQKNEAEAKKQQKLDKPILYCHKNRKVEFNSYSDQYGIYWEEVPVDQKNNFKAKYEVRILNLGEKEFVGNIDLYDFLDKRLIYDKTVTARLIERNNTKVIMMLIPFVGLFAMGMDDYVGLPGEINVSQTLNNQLLKYQVSNVKLGNNQGIEISFETKVDTTGIIIPKK
jgi:hypothetical protein